MCRCLARVVRNDSPSTSLERLEVLTLHSLFALHSCCRTRTHLRPMMLSNLLGASAPISPTVCAGSRSSTATPCMRSSTAAAPLPQRPAAFLQYSTAAGRLGDQESRTAESAGSAKGELQQVAWVTTGSCPTGSGLLNLQLQHRSTTAAKATATAMFGAAVAIAQRRSIQNSPVRRNRQPAGLDVHSSPTGSRQHRVCGPIRQQQLPHSIPDWSAVLSPWLCYCDIMTAVEATRSSKLQTTFWPRTHPSNAYCYTASIAWCQTACTAHAC